MAVTPILLQTDFWLGLVLGALVSALMTGYWRAALIGGTFGLATRLYIEQNPHAYPSLPPPVLPVAVGLLAGLVSLIIIWRFFLPKPTIRYAAFNYGFVPHLSGLVVRGSPVFVNDGQASARQLDVSMYVYKKPEQGFAPQPLADAEIQRYAEEAHDDFIRDKAHRAIRHGGVIAVNVPFSIENRGPAYSQADIQAMSEGRCVFFFATRLSYSGRTTDDFRCVFRHQEYALPRFTQ